MIDRLRVERTGKVNLDIEATESLSTEASTGVLVLSLLYVKPTKGKLVSAELELLPENLEMRRRICVGSHAIDDKQPNEHE
jgi:hypothetical protein